MQFSKELLKGTIEVIVLKAVKDLGEAYGYQLVKYINTTSQDIFSLQEGTLYPLLYRLEENGCVKSVKKNAPNGKERRYYSITTPGSRVLQEKTQEIGLFLQAVKQALQINL